MDKSLPVLPVLGVSVIVLEAECFTERGDFPPGQMSLAKDRADDPVPGMVVVEPPVRGDRGQSLQVEVLR